MQNFTLNAIAGPSAENQPPFAWSKSGFADKYSHVGHPDLWNFPPMTLTWQIE